MTLRDCMKLIYSSNRQYSAAFFFWTHFLSPNRDMQSWDKQTLVRIVLYLVIFASFCICCSSFKHQLITFQLMQKLSNTVLFPVIRCTGTIYICIFISRKQSKITLRTKTKKNVEMPGIEPGAFHMRSERSTTELHPRTTLNIALRYYMNECVFKHGRLKMCVYVSLLSFRWFFTEQ